MYQFFVEYVLVVLSSGRVVESGRHEQLLRSGGLYAGM